MNGAPAARMRTGLALAARGAPRACVARAGRGRAGPARGRGPRGAELAAASRGRSVLAARPGPLLASKGDAATRSCPGARPLMRLRPRTAVRARDPQGVREEAGGLGLGPGVGRTGQAVMGPSRRARGALGPGRAAGRCCAEKPRARGAERRRGGRSSQRAGVLREDELGRGEAAGYATIRAGTRRGGTSADPG